MAPLAVGVTACGNSSDPLSNAPYDASDSVKVSASHESRGVDPAKPLEVTTSGTGDSIADVLATDSAGRVVSGELSADGHTWRSTGPLAAGTSYSVRVSTENDSGAPGRRTVRFATKAASKKLSVSFGPDSGTYGVGQPITAELSHPVKDPERRQLVERALKVDSQPRVEGAWHWVNSKELHYRPKEYWPAHATINAYSRLDGLPVGGGVHGGPSKPLRMRTGDRVEAVADASSLEMRVKKNGKVIKSFPITTGKAGYRTRNGVKVILTKEPFVRMTSASIGASDFYDLPVHWATRLTWTGEYVHGAPWSVGSQGAANVSHGCTGMSSGSAEWFFKTVRQGDLVEHVNTEGESMPAFGNGFGDWNMPWEKWREGSAIEKGTREGSGPAEAARLRPRV
ncbi:hypothetical protein E0L36_04940 [Streptomyces sp. AJS327]|nr:hypothetical protein [Streptomyces sp. AJS327]